MSDGYFRIDYETAREIASVLERHCGLSFVDDKDREYFARALTPMQGGFTEYRFMGALGMGGKVWNNDGRLYVNCYREDQTPERLAMIEVANGELVKIAARLHQEGA